MYEVWGLGFASWGLEFGGFEQVQMEFGSILGLLRGFRV